MTILDPNVSVFIAEFIDSIEQLEILCLLSENPRRSWSAAEVFRVVQSSQNSVASRLNAFVDSSFLKLDKNGRYRFEPDSAAIERTVSLLKQAYRERRVAVVEAIYCKPANPVARSGLRSRNRD